MVSKSVYAGARLERQEQRVVDVALDHPPDGPGLLQPDEKGDDRRRISHDLDVCPLQKEGDEGEEGWGWGRAGGGGMKRRRTRLLGAFLAEEKGWVVVVEVVVVDGGGLTVSCPCTDLGAIGGLEDPRPAR